LYVLLESTMRCHRLSIVSLIFLLASTAFATESPAAAKLGNAQRQFELAKAHLSGVGASKDVQKAFELMKEAAAQGYVEAFSGVGYFYARGLAVEKDEKLAVDWFRKGAEKGAAKAQFNLGKMLAEGKGAQKDEEAGREWIAKAAEQGLPEAVLEQGEIFYFGKFGQTVDYERAYPFLLKAAEAGDAVAQNNIAVMFHFGKGVTLDEAKAAEWYRKAALQGNAKAQSGLGHLLGPNSQDKGKRIESLTWLTVAQRLGEITAIKTLENVLPRVDEDELREARKKAGELESKVRILKLKKFQAGK
jgi:TPR repeat protein